MPLWIISVPSGLRGALALQGVKANPESMNPDSAIARPHSPTTREALTSECLLYTISLLQALSSYVRMQVFHVTELTLAVPEICSHLWVETVV